MQVHIILAAATGESAPTNLPFLLALVAVVISVVALLRVSALKQEPAKPPTPQASPAPAITPAAAAQPAAQTAAEGIPPEIIAVIAAAVATMTGNTRRVISIKPMSTSWERAGRQSVLTSHRIR